MKPIWMWHAYISVLVLSLVCADAVLVGASITVSHMDRHVLMTWDDDGIHEAVEESTQDGEWVASLSGPPPSYYSIVRLSGRIEVDMNLVPLNLGSSLDVWDSWGECNISGMQGTNLYAEAYFGVQFTTDTPYDFFANIVLGNPMGSKFSLTSLTTGGSILSGGQTRTTGVLEPGAYELQVYLSSKDGLQPFGGAMEDFRFTLSERTPAVPEPISVLVWSALFVVGLGVRSVKMTAMRAGLF